MDREAVTTIVKTAVAVAVVVVVLVLVLAAATAGPFFNTGTAEDEGLPVDPDTVLTRVESLTDSRDIEGVRVFVRDQEEISYDDGDTPPFQVVMGMADPNESAAARAYTPPEGDVVVSRQLLDHPNVLESVLSHEFAHVIDFENDVPRRVSEAVVDETDEPGDGRTLVQAILEGGAIYTEEVYWQQYINEGRTPSTAVTASYRNATGRQRYVLSRHFWGYQYVNATIDSPANLSVVYDDPPRTTEQLVHRLPPGSESPAALSVTVEGEGWESDRPRARMGELFIRTMLSGELNQSRAGAGADGWGEDVRISLDQANRDGYVWATKWDDAANASAFRRALVAYLDRRGNRTGDKFQLNSTTVAVCGTADRTIVVCAGDQSFASGTNVEISNDTVTIHVREAPMRSRGWTRRARLSRV